MDKKGTLELLDEKGFVFLDAAGKPLLCRMWHNAPWVFYWHPENKWVSFGKVTQTDARSFPRNLTEGQQQIYRDKHQENMSA